jgi:hypothetical protein
MIGSTKHRYIFNDVFICPMNHQPRISVTNHSDSIIVFQPPPLNAFNSVQNIERSVAQLASLTVSAVEFDREPFTVAEPQ